MKKSVVLKLPVTVDVDPETKACSIKCGKIPPIVMSDGTKVLLQFPATGQYRPKV